MRITQPVLRAIAVLCLFSPPLCSNAQAVLPFFNGKALAGVSAFNASVDISTWMDMEPDKERFRANVESAFHLGLRRDGIVVEGRAPNFLRCLLRFTMTTGGTVVYTYSVDYFTFEPEGVHRLMWTNGAIITVGADNLRPDDVATDCIDKFASEWLRWNPRS